MPVLRPSKLTIKAPGSVAEWDRLMQLVIERADQCKDRRLSGLRKALVDGQSERFLRSLGIISTVDLDREFPILG